MLSVHEAPAPDVNPDAEMVQSEEQQKLSKRIEKLFSKAKKHRKKYDHDWLEHYDIFRGKQWKEARPSYRHSEVINLVFQSLQHSVPIISDIRPKFSFLPQEPQDNQIADILNEVCNADWESNNWGNALLEILYDGHIYGTGLMGVFYDVDACAGMGGIDIHSIDPFYSYPDPNAKDVNKEADFFIYAEPVDVDLLKRQYPKYAEGIKSDLNDLMDHGNGINFDHRHRSPESALQYQETSHQEDSSNKALKIICFYNDDVLVETEEEKDGEKVYVSKKKYPNGRRTVKVSNLIVEDGPNPYDDGKFPYVKWCNYVDPREFWGISEIAQLKGPQRTFNKLLSFALDVLTLMGNPIWVVDDTADIDTDNLVNSPGLIVEKAAGSEVRRESGVQLQPFVMDLIGRMETWFNGLAGTNDVSQGVKPQGVSAASAINMLQEAAETRLRQKSRNLDGTLQFAGQMYLSRFLQFYSAPRVFRITNNGEVNKFLKVEVSRQEQAQGDPSITLNVREFQKTEDNQYKENLQPKEYQVTGKFDVRVSTGSGLPFAKQEKVSKAFELFDRQVIDDEELLKSIDYPNREAVLVRMNEKKAQMAQQQAQQPVQK